MKFSFSKLLEKLKFSNPVDGVFISNFKGCSFYQFFQIATKVESINAINIKSISDQNIDVVLKPLEKSQNLLIYVHGDELRKQCFYKTFQKNNLREDYILNSWWGKFKTRNRKLYFHVCFGSEILIQQPLKDIFTNWVSYNKEVVNVHGGHAQIEKINKKIINQTSISVAKRKNIKSVKTDIEIIYKSVLSDLYEDGETIVGYSAFVASTGRNINALCSSHD